MKKAAIKKPVNTVKEYPADPSLRGKKIPAGTLMSLTDKGTIIPALMPKKEVSDIGQQRKEWESKYTYWLTRKNNFATKLLSKGRTTEYSPKYQELAAKVKEYWQLLHDSKPKYSPL